MNLADEPSCQSCRILLTPMVSIGEQGTLDSISLGPISQVAVDGKGEYAVSTPFMPGRVFFLDGAGRIVGSFGRQGSGPGETDVIEWMRFSPGDTLHVFAMDRWMAVSPQSDHLWTVSLPFRVFRPIRLSSGRWVLTSPYLSAGGQAGRLQVFSSEGRFLDVLPGERPRILGPFDAAAVRHLSPSEDGGFWVARADRYSIGKRTGDGSSVLSIQREVGWFPPHEFIPLGRDEPPIRPTLGGIQEDRNGLLWVIIWVPDDDQERGDAEVQLNQDRRDTLLEVIDPKSGTVLAKARFDDWITNFISGDRVVGRRENRDGEWVLDVFRFELNRKDRLP